jgi:1,4-dihydroxy-2-naphthoate octaprenyltransferase
MARPIEPTINGLRNPCLRYFAATRPAFLTVTLMAGLLGLASAYASGLTLSPLTATLTLFFALLAHAGANVVNDYHDAISGCDAGNQERIYPYTGGSRMIQNGVLSLTQTHRFGMGLLCVVMVGGLFLTLLSGTGLLWIGGLGLFTAWAYSASPCRLQARGLGEIGITMAWLLIVIGADFVQRRHFSIMPVAVGLGYAFLVANVLFINQFPDRKADAASGKRTLVVRWGARCAHGGYIVLFALCHGWTLVMIACKLLPSWAWITLLPLAMSCRAWILLRRYARAPDCAHDDSGLTVAIQLTVVAALVQGGLMIGALVVLAP